MKVFKTYFTATGKHECMDEQSSVILQSIMHLFGHGAKHTRDVALKIAASLPDLSECERWTIDDMNRIITAIFVTISNTRTDAIWKLFYKLTGMNVKYTSIQMLNEAECKALSIALSQIPKQAQHCYMFEMVRPEKSKRVRTNRASGVKLPTGRTSMMPGSNQFGLN